MIYNKFQDTRLSLLGFGTMRLPLLEDGKTINKEEVFKMTDYAMEHGVNYFDTAYPYHEGFSEVVIGEALKKYPRDSFYLATKYPGHQPSSVINPKDTFAEQLQKCGVEYFDFYLLHNVAEFCMDYYMSDEEGVAAYFVEMKKQGKIKHLGFSTHARVENLKPFLDKFGSEMEFCQIQLNYVDYTLQDAKAKLELLKEYNIPVWVMEPVRGGALASNGVDKAFRWLMQFPEIKMILSGMSNFDQMKENIEIFSELNPTTAEENEQLYAFAESIKNSVPCTGCRYCVKYCKHNIDIPTQIKIYNEAKIKASFVVTMQNESIPEEQRSSACEACGECAKQCPQKIDIPDVMKKLTKILNETKPWSQICAERDAAARKMLGLD